MEYKKIIYGAVLQTTANGNVVIFGYTDVEKTKWIKTSRIMEILQSDGNLYVVTMNSTYKIDDTIRTMQYLETKWEEADNAKSL